MNLSNYAENLVAVWLAGGATPSALSTLYLDVHNGEPDETNTNTTSVYQLLTGTSGRKVITPTSSFFSAIPSSNMFALTDPPPKSVVPENLPLILPNTILLRANEY